MELIQPPQRRNSGISPGNGFWFPPTFASRVYPANGVKRGGFIYECGRIGGLTRGDLAPRETLDWHRIALSARTLDIL